MNAKDSPHIYITIIIIKVTLCNSRDVILCKMYVEVQGTVWGYKIMNEKDSPHTYKECHLNDVHANLIAYKVLFYFTNNII